MSEYIRREDAVDAIGEEYTPRTDFERGIVSQMSCDKAKIKALPPADVAPVVHARWLKPTGMMPPEHHGHYECSECGTWAGRDWLRPWKEVLLTNFCPGCGAKMDGKE